MYEIKSLREAMGEDSTHTTGSTSGPFRGVPPRLAESTGTGAQINKEQYTSNYMTQAVTQEDIFKIANPFRKKMQLSNNNLHSILKKPAILNVPLPHVHDSNIQSHSKSKSTTVALVHEPSRSKTSPTTPSLPPSPAIRIEVTDSPPLSPTFTLNEAVTAESTDF
jgi:hypothetical protein